MPVAFILFLAQRDHPEYFWLALFCFFVAGDGLMPAALQLGGLGLGGPGTWHWAMSITYFVNIGQALTEIEFVAVLAGIRSRWFRVIQALILLPAVAYSLGAVRLHDLTSPVAWVAANLLITGILFAGYRHGRKECGVLLALGVVNLVFSVGIVFPHFFNPRSQVHLGGIGVQYADLPWLLFVVVLEGAVLYRFIRVTRDERGVAAELEAARTVQQLLIPTTPPATPGFCVESVYLPAQQVGGDFFLILPGPEDSDDPTLLAVMGDVSGKGLQAAMILATIIGGLRMQLSRAPAEVLSYLNRMLTGHISGFATCCAVLIHQDGRVRIANAGNPSPYCDGEELVTLPGLPLGINVDVVYEETGHVLSNGNRLAFVSDGVVEATSFPHKELFGFDRTRAISTQSARAIAEAASLFGAGAPQSDDITVLTVACTGG